MSLGTPEQFFSLSINEKYFKELLILRKIIFFRVWEYFKTAYLINSFWWFCWYFVWFTVTLIVCCHELIVYLLLSYCRGICPDSHWCHKSSILWQTAGACIPSSQCETNKETQPQEVKVGYLLCVCVVLGDAGLNTCALWSDQWKLTTSCWPHITSVDPALPMVPVTRTWTDLTVLYVSLFYPDVLYEHTTVLLNIFNQTYPKNIT